MLRRFFLTLVLAALTSAAARADLILGFTPDGSVTNFNVPLGQSIQVPIYLIERNQAPLSGDILANFGITGAGVRVDFANSIPSGATGTGASLFQPGWFSPGTYPIINNNPGGLSGNLEIYGGTVGAAALPTGTPPAVRFGTLTFQGNLIGNVTSLSTTNTQPQSVAHFTAGDGPGTILEHQPYGNIFWTGGNPANGNLHYTSTITVIAPEPATILGVCAAAGGLIAWRRNRKKKI